MNPLLFGHRPEQCAGQICIIHNPSNHHMREWQLHWRDDRGLMERVCSHGVGHPDPDHLALILHTHGETAMRTESIHGCDGCCHTEP